MVLHCQCTDPKLADEEITHKLVERSLLGLGLLLRAARPARLRRVPRQLRLQLARA
eukprot:CAMPEP_0206401372 /NCGR_PEP_ID=MMETSP0294-20121207/26224_1 /ASSEMBLY_ACC=CAM_ASM_000327 /TAXON_ID=39354 /ORGANISM="Heterosigma akashiwo, Strain CCMP2393" /LENGTH=55 /DNA_ID=CAMNT_0053858047 /DNA_START=190 /DNA_END=353 /DNA_ORIENTATION=+